MYFEVYNKGKLIKRGTKTLEPISFDNELMLVPSATLVLPIEWIEYFDGWEEVKVFINDKCFWGIVWDIEEDKVNETVTVTLRHVISEWEWRQISVNHAISGIDSNGQLNIVYKGDDVEHNDENDETITASEFTVLLKRAKKMSNADIISVAVASAWVTSNGDKVAVHVSKIEKQDEDSENEKWDTVSNIHSEGTYRVTFATAKGTSVRVDATVEKDGDESYDTVTDATVVDKLMDIYTDMNFAYPGWIVDIEDETGTEIIDYVYSRQNKLEALTQTMELTAESFWRVGFTNEKKVELGKFGEKKPYIFSLKPSGKTNIRIIEEPTIDYDFENVINVATVYSDKSDSGMSSLTLREVYNDKSLQKDGFPVVILHANVNNERDYRKYITTSSATSKIAPNAELEFAVLDERSIAAESGTIHEGTYSFNDMSPFELNGKKISDRKRIKAARTVYDRVIRRLKQARRSYNVMLTTEEIPADLNVGDRVRLLYDNRLWNIEACSSYWKKILSKSDWWFVTALTYDIDETGAETNQVTLSKFIRIDRETAND